MVADHFEKIVRAFQKRAPFRSFTVELASGSRITVDHPEALVLRGGVAVHISATGVPTLFDCDAVTQVSDHVDERAA